ncbi:MAG: porin family protein [Flavobacteriaceae bacterium]|nr:porin family protein [Flavobacteriaceae bacterium]
MRKLLFAAIVTIFSTASICAQGQGDFELGIGVGASSSSATQSSAYDGGTADSLSGPNVSISGEYYYSESWGIKMKLISDTKGWTGGHYYDIPNVDYELKYITIPVMANWHFGSTKDWYLNFGVYMGFLTDATATNNDVELNVKKDFETSDFGFAYGIGYKFKVNEDMKFYLEYEAQSGSAEIFKDDSNGTTTNIRASFNAGLIFNI